MLIRTPLVLAALAALVSTGCVSQEKYNALRLEKDGLNEQLVRASNDTREARTQAFAWKAQLDQLNTAGGSSAALIANLTNQVQTLQKQLSDITAQYNSAVASIGQNPPLSPQLTGELTKFADENPGIVEFDAAKGTVKFKSDLTFASGDAQLQPGAQNAINQFATILNSSSARGYELMVCGHADTQPVSASTASRGHKDNWYLSSHRALSVAEALKSKGVVPARIGAVGYGEFRPIADNGTKAGMQLNRRVEVLILPTQMADARPVTPPANAPANATLEPARTQVQVERADDGLSK